MWSSRSTGFASAALLGLVFTLSAQALAQTAAADKTAAKVVNSDFVHKQFGGEFTLVASEAPLIADFDGDGVADVAIVAKAKNVMMDQAEHNYRVVDPYDDFFGVGDPRITSQFGTEDPERKGTVLLIIHGAGADAWHSETPKAKFVIINFPFKQLTVKHLQVKRKKVVNAVYAEETGGDQMTSAIFFDGKKYKYQPMGSSLQ
jgi:hypothetical protein